MTKSNNFGNFDSKASSDMLILNLLRDRKMSIFEISTAIMNFSGGAYSLVIGVLNNRLVSLLGEGYIQECDDNDDETYTDYFGITEYGRTYLEALMADYNEFLNSIDKIMNRKCG